MCILTKFNDWLMFLALINIFIALIKDCNLLEIILCKSLWRWYSFRKEWTLINRKIFCSNNNFSVFSFERKTRNMLNLTISTDTFMLLYEVMIMWNYFTSCDAAAFAGVDYTIFVALVVGMELEINCFYRRQI